MLKSLFKTSFRSLLRNRTHSLINIVGLAVGVACFIMLSLYVEDEFSYDEFHQDADRMYRLVKKDTSDGKVGYSKSLEGAVGQVLVEELPEVEEAFRIGATGGKVVTYDNKQFLIPTVYLTDSSFFKHVGFGMEDGQFTDVRLGPADVAISTDEALKLFGTTEGVTGRTITISEFGDFQVAAVYKLPTNTIFNFHYITSFENVEKAYQSLLKYFPKEDHKSFFQWNMSAFSTYVILNSPEVNFKLVEPKIEAALAEHWRDQRAVLEPLEDVYFSELQAPSFGRSGERQYANLFFMIAVIILLVAVINYMNMSTAGYTRRAKEVGVRKSIGGTRSSIMTQFFAESLLVSAISMILAICLVEFMLPSLNSFLGKSLDVAYWSTGNLLLFLGAFLVLGLMAGIYPALVLSGFKATEVLKGKVTTGKGGMLFRKFLVSFQFIICIGLLAVTLVVSTQFDYLLDYEKGFQSDQLITVPLKDADLKANYSEFKTEVMRLPGVESVTGSTHKLTQGMFTIMASIEGMEEEQSIALINVESSFVEDLGLDITAGLSFGNKDNVSGKQKALINETAARAFNWNEPLGKGLLGGGDNGYSLQVLGVISDFALQSPKNELVPAMFIPSEGNFDFAVIRLNAANVSSTLAAIDAQFQSFSDEYPFEYSFVDQDFEAELEREKKQSTIFSSFSLLALFIAALGLFGLSIYMVEQKVKEIGIRKVLGASIPHLLWLLNQSITQLILIASLIAIPTSYWLMQGWIDQFPYHFDMNLGYFMIPLAGMLIISMVTTSYHSLKSARANPVKALRTE